MKKPLIIAIFIALLAIPFVAQSGLFSTTPADQNVSVSDNSKNDGMLMAATQDSQNNSANAGSSDSADSNGNAQNENAGSDTAAQNSDASAAAAQEPAAGGEMTPQADSQEKK